MKPLKFIALSGNTLYILWIVYNGIDEGMRGVGRIEAFSLTGLVLLLCINIYLLREPQ